ncbi:MAG: RnfABCDGE type electron transport complex subunit B [Clostridia bacterium]|nr:RnfABCDGE type electron transport complex subunit B [Clostridia bacterium]
MFPAMLSLALIGGLFGVVLAVASKKFHVEVDPRMDAIADALPGSNCGACGYPGCGGLAEAIFEGRAPVDACPPGGSEVAAKIAGIMGEEAAAGDEEKQIIQLMCGGGKENCGDKYAYIGVQDCRIAKSLMGGPKNCDFGCLGLGTCAEVCPFDAIYMDDNDLPVVDHDKCTACGICVETCPQALLQFVGISKLVHVRCRNTERGREARAGCKVACIKCKLCERNCPQDAIHVKSFGEGTVAIIDYDKCDNCGTCVEVCRMNTITLSEEPAAGLAAAAVDASDDSDNCGGCPGAGTCAN